MEYFNILKFAQTQTIQGPAVDNLLQTVKMMFGRGAPTQWDDTGFNKIDYGNPLLEELSYRRLGEAIDIKSATTAIGALKKYKARQVPNWDALYISIQELINASTGFQPTQGAVSENKVTFVKASQYGLIFHIPNIKTKSKNMIYQAISSAPAWQNDRRFNPGDEWKAFSASKNYGMDMYQVNTSFMNEIKAVLDHLGYDTTDFVPPATQPGETPSDITVIKATFNPPSGYNKHSIIINLQKYDEDIIRLIKLNLKRTFDRDTKAWTIYDPELRLVNEILSTCSQPRRKFDVTQLQEATNQLSEFLSNRSEKETKRQTEIDPEAEVPKAEQYQEKGKEKEKELIKIRVNDVSDVTGNAWHIGFGYLSPGTRGAEELKEILRFSFPIYSECHGNGQRCNYKGDPWEARVKGVYQDYITLNRTLTSYGFDTTKYTAICENLLKKGLIKKEKLIGELDGFQTTKNGVILNDYDAFDKALEDNYHGQIEKDGKIIDFKLYDKQKEGIKFLYGRDSALLGDSTGVGKTVQLALAADMRMRQKGGRTVVITVSSVREQFMDEIKRFTKAEEGEVSDNIFAGAKWTVLTYSDFSNKNKDDIKAIVNEILRLGAEKQLQCLILDEIDSVKNSPDTTARTKAIHSISKSFTSVWGASATIVANKPIDVYNQLKAINHPLGNISLSTFKKDFGGMVPGGWNGAMIEGTIESQIKAANKLKEWLVNYGVYIQRSKQDVREDMPEQKTIRTDVDIDEGMLYKNIGQRLKGYKNPELPVSEMIATRTELAISKVDRSLEEAQASLEAGSPKIAIFTCFQQSGKPLIDGLQQVLNNTVGGRVGKIMGGMSKKERLETVKNFKDPNSDMKGLIISIIAGGTGLDFPNVTGIVIVNDFDWTPKSETQAAGRFYRINSESNVEIKNVIAKGTPDEIFYERVKNKIAISDIVTFLTQKQMGLILKGARRGDKKLTEIEQQLEEALRQQIELEEGEKSFEHRMHQIISSGIKASEGQQTEVTANSNWYRRIKKRG